MVGGPSPDLMSARGTSSWVSCGCHGPADGADDAGAGQAQDGGFSDGQVGQPQRPAGPDRQQADRSTPEQSVRRPRGGRQGRLQQQKPGGGAGVVGAGQLCPVAGQLPLQPGLAARRIRHPQGSGHPRRVGDVAVAVVLVQSAGTVALVGAQETVDLGEVHPAQQVRVVGSIRPTVGCPSAYPLVHGADAGDHLLRVAGGAERGHRQEGAGALQPTPRVTAVSRVAGHPGHRQRMQRLQQ